MKFNYTEKSEKFVEDMNLFSRNNENTEDYSIKRIIEIEKHRIKRGGRISTFKDKETKGVKLKKIPEFLIDEKEGWVAYSYSPVYEDYEVFLVIK